MAGNKLSQVKHCYGRTFRNLSFPAQITTAGDQNVKKMQFAVESQQIL